MLLETVVFVSIEVAVEKDWQVNRGGFRGKKVLLGFNLIGEVVGFSDQVTKVI